MSRCLLVAACLLLLVTSQGPAIAASGSAGGTSGGYYYHTQAQGDVDIWKHLYSTNVMHTSGTTTTIYISTSITNSHSANLSISAGGSFFVTLAAEIGFSQTQSFTTQAGH